MSDLAHFRQRLEAAFDFKLRRMPGLAEIAGTFDEMWSELVEAREVLLPFIEDTLPLIRRYVEEGRHVLLEGQLGIMRDLDWGVYPFVTSSSPITGGIAAGARDPAISHRPRDRHHQGVYNSRRCRTVPDGHLR